MRLNYEKVMFHQHHISRDEDDEGNSIPYIENIVNADVYVIAAYIYALIGTLSMSEYEVRAYLTEEDFGNTTIVSLLINANISGVCERPLWSRCENGKLHQE